VLLYAVQGLLPLFASTYDVSPTASSLTLSVATGALAAAILPVSALAESRGRRGVLSISLALAAGLGLLAPLAPTFESLLVVRGLQGAAMAGVPALAMAHVAAEVPARSLGAAMGIFIAGNTFGGLSGRIIASAVADLAGWRWALASVGLVSVGCLVAFRALVPEPRSAPPDPLPLRARLDMTRSLLATPLVRRTCLVSFVAMAAFVSVYNYLGFRLVAEPFGVPQGLVGLVFLAYLFGTASSTLAGSAGDRVGRLPVLAGGLVLGIAGAAVSLVELLPVVLLGLVLVTVGFFAAHSSASSWLSARVPGSGGQASALYLLAYYAGSSLGGTAGGVAFEAGGWSGMVGFVVALNACGLVAAALLARGARSAGTGRVTRRATGRDPEHAARPVATTAPARRRTVPVPTRQE
jgi:YNFM family putative membrane transporter